MTYKEFISEWQNNEIFITARTSGSTGIPKVIKLDKNFVRKSAERTNAFFHLDSTSRLHSCISPDFIGGKMMAVRTDLAKGRLTWETPSNEPLKNIDKEETIDLLAVVPSQMIFLLDNLSSLPNISNIIIGGSPIPPGLRKKIAASGLTAYESYGMTETASHIALRKISQDCLPFTTLPGIKIENAPDNCLTISFDSGEKIKTNDIAEVLSEHTFFIKGRKDQIIISGGRKVNPEELEEKISLFINSPFCIAGFPDEKWGQKVVLILEGNNTETKELRNKLKEIILPWEFPKEILKVKSLPRSDNGKIIRPKDYSHLVFSAPDTYPCDGEQRKQEL